MVMQNDRERLREALLDRRDALGVSQSKYGRIIDREGGTVGAWERGEATPDFAALCALVQKGGIPPESLLGTVPNVDPARAVSAA